MCCVIPPAAAGDIGLPHHIAASCRDHMPEDGDDRWPPTQLAGFLARDLAPPEGHFACLRLLLLFKRLGHGFEAVFRDDDGGGVEVHRLIDGRHDAVGHQLLDDLNRAFFDLCARSDDDAGRKLYAGAHGHLQVSVSRSAALGLLRSPGGGP
jgi:hypothetical protein